MASPARPAPETLAGRRLGRYELLAPIGRGGMATVYLARMHGAAGFSRVVAAKVLSASLVDQPEIAPMFLEEARLAARIRHPNVLEVYDVDTIDGELMMTMRWVEGGSVAALARAFGPDEPMPLGLSLRVIHDALRGLHAAHELETEDGRPAGLVHRDVSPPNLLVDVGGSTLLADFGVAKAMDRAVAARTQENIVKGKLGYMAPEQLSSEQAVDRRTDVFATGIVLWELLTGRRLFGSADPGELVHDVLHMPIPPPGTYRTGVPMALDEIVLRALERDPARRFATAADFADALEATFGAKMMSTRELGGVVAARLAGSIERQRAALKRSTPPPPVPSVKAEPPPTRRRWAALAIGGGLTSLALAALAAGSRDARPIAGAPATASAAPPPPPADLPPADPPRPAPAADPPRTAPTDVASPPPSRRAWPPPRRPPRASASAAPSARAPFVPTEP